MKLINEVIKMKRLLLFFLALTFTVNAQVYPLESFSSALGKYFEEKTESYGVEWNWDTDSYTRLGSLSEVAVGVKPSEPDLTVQNKIRRCVLNDAGQVQYYLREDNSYFTENGDSSKLNGDDGQVMVEIPEFFYQITWSSSSVQILIAPDSIAGFTKMAKRYIGAYPASLYDTSAAAYVTDGIYQTGDLLASVSGVMPKTNETRAEFRTAATERGSGWHQLGYEDYFAIQLLMVTEYADFNTQDVIGEGNTKFAAWDYNANISFTGKSNADGNSTANQSTAGGDSTDYVSYRGIEDVYGNTWQFLDGINVNNDGVSSKLWINSDYSTWADDVSTNYTFVGALAQSDGYITNLVRTNSLFAPSEVGGSSSTYLADYYDTRFDNNASSGWHVLLVGGRANHGGVAGVFCGLSYYGSTYAHPSIGGRLAFTPSN